MENLIQELIKEDYLKTPLIIEAFRNINREDFVLEDLKDEAGINAPLPIGYGQTISQPLTVAFMLELLQPKPGEKIGILGKGYGPETDGERKHLHLGVHKGKIINPRGHVQTPEELNNWIDITKYL